MLDLLPHIKGLHPGLFLERELKKRNLKKRPLAISINEHPQTLGSIINGNRRMNIPLAAKIEKLLGLEEGLLMTLQVFYDIKKHKAANLTHETPDLSKINPALFWDTSLQTIDWIKMKNSVIQRVRERGTKEELNEILNFYENQ